MSSKVVLPVSHYSRAASETEKLLEYPGPRPKGSFITDGDRVTLLPDEFTAFTEAADDALIEQGLPTIAERIPVLAYGANASPARLADKMKKFGSKQQTLMQTVPHIVATLPDTAAIWHGRPGQSGSVFAELYKGEHAEGTDLQAHVAFLTAEQLAALHTSEGVTYSAAELPAKLGAGADAPEVNVAAYVALASQISVQRDGRPILVRDLRHNNLALPNKSATRMVEKMLRAANISVPVQNFVEETHQLPLSKKKEVQAAIGDILARKRLSQKFAFTEADSPILIGRADFTSLPGSPNRHVWNLPETILAKIRPSETEIATRMEALAAKFPDDTEEQLRARASNLIDPSRMVSRRAHDELATRTGLETVKEKR